MPSASLALWQNDRSIRLNDVEAHSATVAGLVPSNATFLDETLRGFILHLSAHFQGFCRDLYTECAQIYIAAIPRRFVACAQAQFFAGMSLERGNPSYDNLKKDFNRFGLSLDLQAVHPAGSRRITDLGHLNDWRNRAAHQATHPFGSGVPTALSLSLIQKWKASCDGLAESLDDIMRGELSSILGNPPW